MGMFDTLYINTNRLPISRAEKKLLGENPEWQTKDWELVGIRRVDEDSPEYW
jgi:hypothetical protein